MLSHLLSGQRVIFTPHFRPCGFKSRGPEKRRSALHLLYGLGSDFYTLTFVSSYSLISGNDGPAANWLYLLLGMTVSGLE